MGKFIYYVEFLAAFFAAQMTSMWGQYFTLKYPHMGQLEAFLRAIPFAWIDWFFMSVAIGIGDKYQLVTPTQDTFLLIIVQFCTILLINHFFLKQPLSRSDIITFFVILLGFYISFEGVVSKFLGIVPPPPKKVSQEIKVAEKAKVPASKLPPPTKKRMNE